MKELSATHKAPSHASRPVCQAPTVEVDPSQPLSCPPLSDASWSGHPRVFLMPNESGEAVCPYCGMHYAVRGA